MTSKASTGPSVRIRPRLGAGEPASAGAGGWFTGRPGTLITGYPPDVTAKLTAVSASVTPSTSSVRPQRSQTVALVPFLFGVTGTDELAGVALTRLLGDLGIGAAAARQQLARMRRDGQLSASRRGRGVDYRLAGPFAATFRRLRAGAVVRPPC